MVCARWCMYVQEGTIPGININSTIACTRYIVRGIFLSLPAHGVRTSGPGRLFAPRNGPRGAEVDGWILVTCVQLQLLGECTPINGMFMFVMNTHTCVMNT